MERGREWGAREREMRRAREGETDEGTSGLEKRKTVKEMESERETERQRERRGEHENRGGKEKSWKNRCAEIACLQ